MNSAISQVDGGLKFSLEAEAKLKLSMERAARMAATKLAEASVSEGTMK